MSVDKKLVEQAGEVFDRLFRQKFSDSFNPLGTIGKTKSTGARVSEEKYEELVQLAEQENCTVNFLINIAVYKLLEESSQHDEKQNKAKSNWLTEFEAKSFEEQEKSLLELKAKAFDLKR